MDIIISPKKLSGTVNAVSSKSDAHRKIIAAALSNKETQIIMNNFSDDIDATLDAIKNLGGDFVKTENGVKVKPISKTPEKVSLDFCESGSTARFLLPITAALCENAEFSGRGRLPERPFADLTNAMRKNGVAVSSDNLPIKTSGKLKSGVFEIRGDVSSQYITGLLFALLNVDGESKIHLTSELLSAPYVDMTLDTLKAFGAKIEVLENEYIVKPQKLISPETVAVEGDWSQAAFWVVANKICGNIEISGMNEKSRQGDKRITEILDDNEIDATHIPDLVPILSVLAASRVGTTRIYGAERLRIKESDRLFAMTKCINDLGGCAKETEDGIIIEGTGKLSGGVVDSFSDHRIAMATAVASLICENEVKIMNAECVKKSYPAFFEDFKKLGGVCHVCNG